MVRGITGLRRSYARSPPRPARKRKNHRKNPSIQPSLTTYERVRRGNSTFRPTITEFFRILLVNLTSPIRPAVFRFSPSK